MAERITEQWRALMGKDKQRRELFANVSHDLRTPLTSLHGFLETLAAKRDLTDAERQRYLEIALAQSEKVSRLAHELFELARLEHAAARPTKSRSPSATSCTTSFRSSYCSRAKGASASSRRPAKSAERDRFDPLIERVLTNLLDNAIRHSSTGGEIGIALRATPSGVEVHVRDAGPGIPLELLEVLEARGNLRSGRAW